MLDGKVLNSVTSLINIPPLVITTLMMSCHATFFLVSIATQVSSADISHAVQSNKGHGHRRCDDKPKEARTQYWKHFKDSGRGDCAVNSSRGFLEGMWIGISTISRRISPMMLWAWLLSVQRKACYIKKSTELIATKFKGDIPDTLDGLVSSVLCMT